jgi:hypothetical protein
LEVCAMILRVMMVLASKSPITRSA